MKDINAAAMESLMDKRKSTYKTCCFFCLQCSSKISDSEQSYSQRQRSTRSFQQVSLRNLTRYLESIHSGYKNVDLKRKLENYCSQSESDWFFCECCTQLAFEFNELYHLMENIKMRLNWCLDKMKDVMTTTTTTALADAQADSGQGPDLRAAVLEQIKSIIPVPRIVLCKAELEVKQEKMLIGEDLCMQEMEFNSDSDCPRSEHAQEVFIPSPSAPEWPESPIIKMECDEGRGSHVEEETDGRPLYPEPTPTHATGLSSVASSEEVSPNPPELKSETGRKKVNIFAKTITKTLSQKRNCSFCRALLSSNYHHQLHMVQHHCEQLFPNFKLDFVTDLQFKKIVGELLFKDLVKEKEDTFCAYCNRHFRNTLIPRNRTWYYARVKAHIVQCHYNELEDSLRKLQRNPNLTQILLQCESTSTGEICGCGTYIQNQWFRAVHVKWHCNLTSKRREEKESILSNFTSDQDHDQVQSSFKLTCKLCNTLCPNAASAQSHWKYSCEKGARLQRPDVIYITCAHCKYKCGKYPPVLMKKHLARRHPELFFISERDSNSKAMSKWKYDHFKSLVVDVALPEFIKRDSSGVDSVSCSCSVCGKIYNTNKYIHRNRSELKVHVMSKHIPELREHLNLILELSDASLQEKLNSVKGSKTSIEMMDDALMVVDGESCVEGDYQISNDDIDPLAMD